VTSWRSNCSREGNTRLWLHLLHCNRSDHSGTRWRSSEVEDQWSKRCIHAVSRCSQRQTAWYCSCSQYSPDYCCCYSRRTRGCLRTASGSSWHYTVWACSRSWYYPIHNQISRRTQNGGWSQGGRWCNWSASWTSVFNWRLGNSVEHPWHQPRHVIDEGTLRSCRREQVVALQRY
jgi:hypothetical protein